MSHPNHAIVREIFAAMPSGKLPEHLLADDLTAWTTLRPHLDKKAYLDAIAMLGKMCSPPIEFTIRSLTAEEDRVAAEVSSEGTLINGESYQNTYFFMLRIRDGRVCHISEHFNAITVREKLVPLMQQLLTEKQ